MKVEVIDLGHKWRVVSTEGIRRNFYNKEEAHAYAKTLDTYVEEESLIEKPDPLIELSAASVNTLSMEITESIESEDELGE